MRLHTLPAALGLAALLGSPVAAPRLSAQEPVVHAVLFYSPTCPHCHDVINNVLPPLRQKHGERLVIIGVDVTTLPGQELYQATVAHFALPEERLGVPTLVVGTEVMVGSGEIPERFPGLIERGLASGGIDWPAVGELRRVLTAQGLLVEKPATPPEAPADSGTGRAGAAEGNRPAAAPADSLAGVGAPAGSPPREAPDSAGAAGPPPIETLLGADSALSLERPGPRALFMQDPTGNGIAVAVLVGLLAVLAWSVTTMLGSGASAPGLPSWLFPALGVVGAGIAAYLSFVEVTGATAVCGPVGDCNTVQQSAWARLFGVIPVGLMGLAGYAALLAAWAAATWGPPDLRTRAWTAAWGMAVVGTAFSAWLTFLEPFVIGATCAWCVSSALVMAVMLVLATGRAARRPA